MKQTNNLLNISNIMVYIFYIALIFIFGTTTYGEYYTICLFSLILIYGILNLIVGIYNIIKKNKSIGIINVIISIMFSIVIILHYNSDCLKNNGMVIFLVCCLFSPIILSIINLIINRKNQDLTKRKYKRIIFCLGIIMELSLIAIPFIINYVNFRNFEVALEVLEKEENTISMVFYDNQNAQFFSSNGELVCEKKLTLLNDGDASYTTDRVKTNTNKTFVILLSVENNEIWIVDYFGEKVSRLYNLFQDEALFKSSFFDLIEKKGIKTMSNSIGEGTRLCIAFKCSTTRYL